MRIDKSFALRRLKTALILQIVLLIGVYFASRYQLKIEPDFGWLIVGIIFFALTHIFIGLTAKTIGLNGAIIGFTSSFWPVIGGCVAIVALYYKIRQTRTHPQYEPDDGPLTEEQFREIEARAAPELARIRRVVPNTPRKVSSSLFGITS